MNKVLLTIEDLDLGYLEKKGDKFVFFANPAGIRQAREQYPYDMKLFMLSEVGMTQFDDIPYPYSEYINYCDRTDIASKAKISEEDSDFDKLYKVAGLEMERVHFSIKRYQ
ncbi:MAG: hypothetical protein IJW59_01460 [Clostridia bacterium]|nr:hypothetical protein [Clostridia bacterium]